LAALTPFDRRQARPAAAAARRSTFPNGQFTLGNTAYTTVTPVTAFGPARMLRLKTPSPKTIEDEGINTDRSA
jgi:hypothetical protein